MQGRRNVCKFHQQGNCRFGLNCRDLHEFGQVPPNLVPDPIPNQDPSPDPKTAETKFQDIIKECEARIKDVMARRSDAVSLQELESLVAQHDVLKEELKELNTMLGVFRKSVADWKKGVCSPGFMSRDIRRLVPSQGKCLPFFAFRNELVDIIRKNRVSIVIGQTGSGKSTQMIQYIVDAGLDNGGQVVCCQPRKLAATSLASRVSEEWTGRRDQVGKAVGFHVGAARKETPGETRMKFVTNRVLLNEILVDPTLRSYSVVIVDEAHERTIDTDILLGMLRQALRKRGDLKVVITSATLDDKLMSDYFGDCPVVRIPGRTFPVEVRYQEQEEDFVGAAWKKASDIVHSKADPGHVLVFLTGQEDIELAIQRFRAAVHDLKGIHVLPLHGKLPPEETDKVFAPVPAGERKVIFATNQAETSITIEGVRHVVDSGMAKVASYDAARGMQVLETEMVSRSSAEQRKGRAGRTAPGVCYRLYSQEDFDSMREGERAEILRSHLGICLLQLKQLGIRDVEHFEFIEPPSQAAMDSAVRSLRLLGCLDAKGSLTERGRHTAQLEMEPMVCRMLLEGCRLGVGDDCLAIAAIASAGGSVFFRGGGKEDKEKADRVILSQSSPDGDLCTLLSVFRRWQAEAGPDSTRTREEQRKWCTDHCANGKTLSTAQKVLGELRAKLARLGIEVPPRAPQATAADKGGAPASIQLLRRAICEGFFMNLAASNGPVRAGFLALASGQNCSVHPASALVAESDMPRYVVFQEMAQTTRLFLRGLTPVDVAWVREIAPDFIKSLPSSDELCTPGRVNHVSPVVMRALVGRQGAGITALEREYDCVLETRPHRLQIRVWARPARLDRAVNGVVAKVKELVDQLMFAVVEAPAAGRTRMIVEAGGVVRELLHEGEFTRLFVSNVRGWDEMLRLLRADPAAGYVEERCAGSSDDGGAAQSGTVRFETKEKAKHAREVLDGRIQNRGSILARPCVTQATGVQQCRDTVLRISWYTGECSGAATVYLVGRQEAEAAAAALHDLTLEGRRVECKLRSPGGGSSVRMTVTFAADQTGLVVGKQGANLKALKEQSGVSYIDLKKDQPGHMDVFGDLDSVNKALTMLQKTVPARGQIVVEAAKGGKAQADRPQFWSLKLSGLPKHVFEEDLMEALADRRIAGVVSISVVTVTGPSPNTGQQLDMAVIMLQSVLSEAARGLGELEDLQMMPPNHAGGRAKAFATFSTPGCVAKAVDLIHCKRSDEFGLGGTGRIQALPDLGVSVLVPEGLARALAADLNEVLAAVRDNAQGRVKVDKVDKGARGTTLRVSGESEAAVTMARLALDRVLAGRLFSCRDDKDGLERLLNPKGRKEMEHISESTPGVYVQWDRRVNQIFLFGKPEPRRRAEEALLAYVERCKREEVWVYDLPRGGARCIVGRNGRGLDALREQSGAREMSLNLMTRKLTCSGTADAIARARELVGEAMKAADATVDPEAKTGRVLSEGAVVECGVCLCDVEEGQPRVDLVCGHSFHPECVAAQLLDHSRPSGAPLPARCMGDGGRCLKPMSVCDIRSVCGEDTWTALCRRGLRAYVESHAADLAVCPTADCPQVVTYRHPGAWQCDCCLRRYCIPCTLQQGGGVDAHNDMSCEEFRRAARMAESAKTAEAALQELLASDITAGILRKCPNCGLAQQKVSGCNHVSCHACKRHWCWACADFHAADGSPVYAHQGSCRGYHPGR